MSFYRCSGLSPPRPSWSHEMSLRRLPLAVRPLALRARSEGLTWTIRATGMGWQATVGGELGPDAFTPHAALARAMSIFG